MATRAFLQTLCAPSPLALTASAVLHAWTGDWVDAAAALSDILSDFFTSLL